MPGQHRVAGTSTRQVGVEPLHENDPRQVGEIVLHGRLGAGGMGRVFFGATPEYEPVAVKVIREDFFGRREILLRFQREIDALRSVQSPAVAGLVDADAGPAFPWIAIEYVRGLTLRESVEQEGRLLDRRRGAALGVVLAEALTAVHDAGLLHRDLKPGNVLLGATGPKVIDLGLVTYADAPSELTASGAVMGTPACMPPEQLADSRSVTAAADVYALGATLLFALTGHYPYTGTSLPILAGRVMNPDLPPNLDGAPPEFVPLLAALLAHAQADRPAVAEARAALVGLATADGDPLPVVLRRLALATYRERPDDPPEITPPPRPRRERVPGPAAHPAVAALAASLRDAYAADAAF
ncbi:serine/threonine-protein kinase [Actinocorallia sp. B10E7]|uniref:serine/threonine-protein kinase n=1 Tax=Actinocorallia sp. B10E7 TaxID=3153558 RepID=UPI00325DEB67